MSGFAQAVREGAFSKRNHTDLVEGTVATTLAHVAQAFRANDRNDPRLDHDGKTCFILQEQYRGYSNQDKGQKKQKALPVSVLRKMMDIALTDKEKCLSWLCIGAFFFAMRSCEYLKSTHKEDSKRTKILRLRNFKAKMNGRALDFRARELSHADMIMITFETQKNDTRNKTIHMFRTGDKLMCPVIAWATTIKRILDTIPGASGDTKVSTFNDLGRITEITSTYARAKIRSITELIGEEELGFSKEEVGLHSIRSGGAMAMFLSGVSDIIIQRIGRWESNAFLEYIREQVENFTYGVSEKMLYNEGFQHLDPNAEIEESCGLQNAPNNEGSGGSCRKLISGEQKIGVHQDTTGDIKE